VLSVLENGDYDESSALALACTDLGLAVDLTGQVGVPAELSALVDQIYRRARPVRRLRRRDAPYQATRTSPAALSGCRLRPVTTPSVSSGVATIL
jgi:hypothetical protein